VIEPTDEMIAAFERDGTGGWGDITDTRAGLAAVLAIVERDYAIGPAMCDEPHPTEDLAYCELPRGHAEHSGRGHSATVTKAVEW
jgi:hypothetical protein